MIPKFFLAAVTLAMAAGCSPEFRSGPEQCLPEGYVYYLDGSGGGSAVLNWSGGVRQGLKDAGYNAFGEMFTWETGLGPLADQASSEAYKQARAKDLVSRIAEHRQACAADPVHLVALSAGTAVAVYALEQLPDGQSVDNVALLGASISADHDLTRALRHVRGHVYVFTNPNDSVLADLVPLVGTADGKPGTAEAAGLRGFIWPAGASAETRQLYNQKLVTVDWRPAFEADGHFGNHLDNVNAAFIRDHVAPRLMGAPPPGR
jgi:pimeloyl-ACP methyl ester carboxylesterase